MLKTSKLNTKLKMLCDVFTNIKQRVELKKNETKYCTPLSKGVCGVTENRSFISCEVLFL